MNRLSLVAAAAASPELRGREGSLGWTLIGIGFLALLGGLLLVPSGDEERLPSRVSPEPRLASVTTSTVMREGPSVEDPILAATSEPPLPEVSGPAFEAPKIPSRRLDVPFQEASARLPSNRRWLRKALAWQSVCPLGQYVIDGHADAVGRAKDNLALSWRRAQAVARALRGGGIPSDRLAVRAFGNYQPKLGVGPIDRRQRRVEVQYRCPPAERLDP